MRQAFRRLDWRNRPTAMGISPLAAGRGAARGFAFRGRSLSRAFTFLEIMLVVAIIGILVAIVGPRLIGRTQKAKIAATRMQIQNFKTNLADFEMSAARFPSTQEGLKALIEKPSGLSKDEWDGPYLDDVKVPKDPWGNAYKYVQPGEHRRDYDIWSFGPDKTDGTKDDITNWQSDEESQD